MQLINKNANQPTVTIKQLFFHKHMSLTSNYQANYKIINVNNCRQKESLACRSGQRYGNSFCIDCSHIGL